MLNCEVCGFSFLDAYGELGEGFIEAHHKNPMSLQEGEIKTTLDDIALVCSNCHRMLHKGNPVLSVEELKERMENES
jgi:5-methylcytosine-specific restriction protein A